MKELKFKIIRKAPFISPGFDMTYWWLRRKLTPEESTNKIFTLREEDLLE